MSRIPFKPSLPANNNTNGFMTNDYIIQTNNMSNNQPQYINNTQSLMMPNYNSNNNNMNNYMHMNMNMNLPIIDENNAIKKFNIKTPRSNSSSSTSSTSSSIMSNNNINQNIFMSNNSLSPSTTSFSSLLIDINNNNNHTDQNNIDIKTKNDSLKLFNDDIFYCPRSLFNNSELQKVEIIDKLLIQKMVELNNFNLINYSQLNNINLHTHHQNFASPSHSPKQSNIKHHQSINKFNPYTSKSFSPSSF